MSSVSIRNVVKKYPGGVLAVSDLSLEINDGALVVLVGPSGCGKSTLLRMIAGLEKVTSGEIRIDHEPVTHLEPGERNIAMVFQNYALYPHMSVRRNLEYGLRNEGLPKSEREVRINRAANMLHIEELLNRKPRELSGGQRQRVAMGRAIVREPRVFLFDEPLSNLDAKLRTELRAELKKLHRELSGTFLFVTHDQLEAMSLADQIVVMNQGQIEQTGSPMELYSDPNSLFVAEFIGNTGCNLIPATCVDKQTLKIDVPDSQHQLVLQDETLQDLHLNSNGFYTVAIRPEHLIIDQSSKSGLNARIILIEKLGADTMLHCALEGAEDIVLICRAPGSLSISEGAAVSLLPGAGQLIIFDTKTGARIRAL